ncbi:MAG: DMT family transporter [Deltaproteobacteria bacterium]|jgi:drug/metabolite transporter (DMT)-like permease|nr:DMT family transporter [Deltaproteobacteria bacterium]
MTLKTKAILLLLTATIIWGVSSPINRHAMTFVNPWPFSAVRYLFGSVALLPLVLRWGHRKAPAQYFHYDIGRFMALKSGLCLGFLLTVGTALQLFGLTMTTASKSGFITSLYVSMVALFGFVMGQIPRRQVWIGLSLCLIGLAFIGGNTAEQSGFNLGDALTLVADLIWVAHIVIMGYFAVRVNPWKLVASQSFVCSLLCFIIALSTDTMCSWPEFVRALPSMAWGVMAVSVAYVCQAVAQINTSPAAAAITLQFQPVIGATCGVIFLGEQLSWPMGIGAALLIAGALTAQRAQEPVKITADHPRYEMIRAARLATAILILGGCGLSVWMTI